MVDWDKRAVQIAGRMTKTGKPIYVPLNSVALEVLKRRYAAKDRHPEWVFHYRGERITQVLTKTWRAARAAANLPGVSFHTMRHCGQVVVGTGGRERRDAGAAWWVVGEGTGCHGQLHPPLHRRPTAHRRKTRGAVESCSGCARCGEASGGSD